MKKTFISVLCLLVGALFLASCATPYQIIRKDGFTVESVDEPEYNEDSGFFEYETLDGREHKLNKDHVIELLELK